MRLVACLSVAVLLLVLTPACRQGGAATPAKPATTLEEATARLQLLTGVEPRPYCTFDYGQGQDRRGRSVVLPKAQVPTLLMTLRGQLGPGLTAYAGTDFFQIPDPPPEGSMELVVAPVQDQFDILRLARTSGANYGYDTEEVIAELRKLDQKYGIEILMAQPDVVGFRMTTKPDRVSIFVREVQGFCPDFMAEDGEIVFLREALAQDAAVVLWWD